MIEPEARLRELAAGNEPRQLVLQERAGRRKVRWKDVVCPACHEREFTKRAAQDICDACLVDLWNARDIIAGAYERANSDALQPVSCTSIPHRLEYPRLATRSERIPNDASFARPASNYEDTNRLLQAIYADLLTQLSVVLPCDPQSREGANPVILFQRSYRQEDIVYTRLPAGAVKALRDLWNLVRWHSHEAFRQGYAAGHDLLSRLNLGQETAETFSAQIERQTRQLREEMEQIEHNKRPPHS